MSLIMEVRKASSILTTLLEDCKAIEIPIRDVHQAIASIVALSEAEKEMRSFLFYLEQGKDK